MKTMKPTWTAVLAGSALLITLGTATIGAATPGQSHRINGSIRVERQLETEFPTMARISMDQAVAAALAAVPGRVLSVDLDDEDGFLVYEVKIVTTDKTTVTSVTVDAGDGRILATERDWADR